MQILQWLFKAAHDHQTGKKPDKEVNENGIVLVKCHRGSSRRRRAEQTRLKCKNFRLFYFFRGKDIAKTYFYNTLNLKRVGSHRRRQHFVRAMNTKRENLSHGLSPNRNPDSSSSVTATVAHVGSTKVLPVSNDHNTGENGKCHQSGKKEDRGKGQDKTKTMSKMKELLRWAAAAKSEKGEKFFSRKALQFRNKPVIKAVQDDDELSNESPKISFRWEVESCSTTYSEISMASYSTKNDQSGKPRILSLNSTPVHREDQCGGRAGNWITTDSEFVVLEL